MSTPTIDFVLDDNSLDMRPNNRCQPISGIKAEITRTCSARVIHDGGRLLVEWVHLEHGLSYPLGGLYDIRSYVELLCIFLVEVCLVGLFEVVRMTAMVVRA